MNSFWLLVQLLMLLASMDLLLSEQLETTAIISEDASIKDFVAHLFVFMTKFKSDEYLKNTLPQCSTVDLAAFRAEHLNKMSDSVESLLHIMGQGNDVAGDIDDAVGRVDTAVSHLDSDVNTTRSSCYLSREFRDDVYVPLASGTMVTLCAVMAHGTWKTCGTLDDSCSLQRVNDALNCSLAIMPYLESQSQGEGQKHLQVAVESVRQKLSLSQEMLERMDITNLTLTDDMRSYINYYLRGLEYLSSNYRKVMHPAEFRHHKKRSSWQLVKRYSVRRLDHSGTMPDWFSSYRQFISSVLDSLPDGPSDANTTFENPVWTNDNIFVDSPCLCHLSYFDNCNMWTRTSNIEKITGYCVAVMLENLRSAATVRMVISFLDYSLAKKVSTCALKKFLVGPVRDDFCLNVVIDPVVEHGSNVSVPEISGEADKASLCLALERLSNTHDCTKDDSSSHPRLAFYIYRHAVLQIAFAVVDVLTRIASLVVYLSISELRNLPGKCFIAFQLTALVNGLFVRYLLPESKLISLQILVYLENFLTLSSSFWLNIFCGYLYHCFATMTLPNSLCARKVRKIFWRFVSYATFSPAVFTLICMVTDFTNAGIGAGSSYSAYEYGKVAFFAANFAALLFNLVMYSVFVVKINRVRKEVEKVIRKRNPELEKKFTQLLHFTTKVFVLSSAGFLVRTLVYQIEDIERLINVVYLGSLLEGPLVFRMFVCNNDTKRLVNNKVNHIPSGKTSRFYVKCEIPGTLNVRTSNWATYRHSGISLTKIENGCKHAEDELSE